MIVDGVGRGDGVDSVVGTVIVVELGVGDGEGAVLCNAVGGVLGGEVGVEVVAAVGKGLVSVVGVVCDVVAVCLGVVVVGVVVAIGGRN